MTMRTIFRAAPIVLLSLFFGVLTAQERDPRADELADKVMAAMGGQENYNNTRYITWKFFGKRLHVWDKWTGNLRYEDGKGGTVLMNVNTKEGKAWKDGAPVQDQAELEEILEGGYRAWINDSYWLVMPYKLKDPGVHLVYSREDKMEDGKDAYVLTLTFDSVGVTPDNKYEVFIDKESMLVKQWNFFRNASDAEPGFKTPWINWQTHGKILLSDDRGKSKHTDVAVFDSLPETVFTSPDPVDFSNIKP